MIHLRELNIKDSKRMLDLMHDRSIQNCFKKNMNAMSLEDTEQFIQKFGNARESLDCNRVLHLAIALDDNDLYVGTVSLKNVDIISKNAEFAIVTMRECRGCGVGKEAMSNMLDIAFNRLQLNKVYLNVISNNITAISLYEKMNFRKEGYMRQQLMINGEYCDLIWYGLLKEEYYGEQQNG